MWMDIGEDVVVHQASALEKELVQELEKVAFCRPLGLQGFLRLVMYPKRFF